MCVPLKPGLIDKSRAANGDLADVIRQRVLGADGA